MNANQRKRKMQTVITIGLSVLLAATVFITVFAFISGKKTKPSETTVTPTAQSTEPLSTTTPKTETQNPPGSTPVDAHKTVFILPVQAGVLGKNYSADIPVFSMTMEDYRVHTGIDITADAGTPVCASADGIVEKIEFDPMMGQSVTLVHSSGYVSVYRSLSTKMPEGLAVGSNVLAGDTIGYAGDTALIEISEAPHVHFEILKDGVNENPLTYMSVKTADDGTTFED